MVLCIWVISVKFGGGVLNYFVVDLLGIVFFINWLILVLGLKIRFFFIKLVGMLRLLVICL